MPAPTTSCLDSEKIAYYAGRESGRANIDLIHLREILMDEENPRTKGIDIKPLLDVLPDFLVLDIKHVDYDAKLIERFDVKMSQEIKKLCAGDLTKEVFFESLIPLRNNIRLLGVLQPIEVTKKDRYSYQIRYGHRRFIASILAGEKGIFARVVSASRSDNKITQLSENAHQQKLRLYDRIQSLSLALEELGLDSRSAKPTKVARLLGMDRGIISNQLSVLNCDSVELMAAIEKGQLRNLKSAAVLAMMDEEERSLGLAELIGEAPKVKEPAKTKKKGRAKLFLSTPKVKNPQIFINIMRQLNFEFDGIDEKDIYAVQEKWDDFIKTIEKQCLK